MSNQTLKFSLSGYPERYELPGRPGNTPRSSLDAHRQTHFLLPEDLTLFERAMNAQLAIVATNARTKDPHAGILFAYWARVFSHLSDACGAVCLGSYTSCPPLLRVACDCLAAQRALIEDGFAESDEWASTAVSRSTDDGALAINSGRYRAASALAADETLGRLYRIVSELSMPSFGGTVLQSSPDITTERAPTSFDDGSFHLAWAQLCLGWILSLSSAQLQTIAGSDLFSIDEGLRGEVEHLAEGVGAVLEASRRCYIDDHGGGGFVLHNYRRTTTGQPKRVLLT